MHECNASSGARRSWAAAAAIAVAMVVLAGVAPADESPPLKAGPPRGIVRHHKGVSLVGRLPNPDSSLQYFGGPVLRTNETFAIFWDPAGQLSQGYRDLVLQYLQDVAADSGQTTNVYSVLNQYYDQTGPIAYQSTFAGSLIDTNPYPQGCPALPGYPVCFTDQQLAREVDEVLFARGIERPANRAFLVFTPAGVNSCFDSTGRVCRSNVFCGYHSGFTGGHGDAIYANLPYNATPGCDLGEHPNGSDADPVLDTLSHEHREMIDDPFVGSVTSLGPPLAWYDPFSFNGESSDKCAYYFGPVRRNGVGAYNQVINGHQYLLQAEWSNELARAQGLGCVLDGTDRAPTAVFASTVRGAVARFDGGESSDPDPDDSIELFAWLFGDGTIGFGPTPLHRYEAAGTYSVILIISDSHGASSFARHDVVAEQPVLAAALTARLQEALDDRGSVTGSGTVSRLGSIQETPGFVFFDFSNFPVSLDVFNFTLWSNKPTEAILVSTHLTLTDHDSPPKGNNYDLSGTYALQGGVGAFANATGTGTISGTCTSSFTSDVAQCTERWKGTFAPE
jgi:PKD repeat protein